MDIVKRGQKCNFTWTGRRLILRDFKTDERLFDIRLESFSVGSYLNLSEYVIRITKVYGSQLVAPDEYSLGGLIGTCSLAIYK